MEEPQGVNQHGHEGEPSSIGVKGWMGVAAAVLLEIAAVGFGYGYRQQAMVGQLTAQESAANATINDMQGQLTTLTAKLNEMSAAQLAAAEAAAQKKASAGHAGTAGGKNPSGKKKAPRGKKNKKATARPETQQKQLNHNLNATAKKLAHHQR